MLNRVDSFRTFKATTLRDLIRCLEDLQKEAEWTDINLNQPIEYINADGDVSCVTLEFSGANYFQMKMFKTTQI